VPVSEAVRLGLHPAPCNDSAAQENQTVEIPRWRLAQINFRHPLLAQGLRILDTPGLNALGHEPELTYEMLPNAQAVLFVLGADTGVTRSDLEMWQQFIRHPGRHSPRGLAVVLNKTDALWDDLRHEQEVELSITRQCRDVARALDIAQHQVFATSAQKALVSRVRGDRKLEERTRIGEIETYLSEVVLENRRDLLKSNYAGNVSDALETLAGLVTTRLQRANKHSHNLEQLSGQSTAALAHMLREAQHEKRRYKASVEAYRVSREDFRRQGRVMIEALNLKTLEKVIERAYAQMADAWTTPGLKKAMRILFEEIDQRMQSVSAQTQSMRRLVRTIYRRFQTEHDFQPLQPAMFSIVKYQVELGLLRQEADVFRNSARTVMTEQRFVIKRYFRTIVNRARRIFRDARGEAFQWLTHSMDPLTLEVRENRGIVSRQIQDLKDAEQSRKTIQQRVQALQRDAKRLQGQLSSLRNVLQALHGESAREAGTLFEPGLLGADGQTASA
jgi:hypothetical protein